MQRNRDRHVKHSPGTGIAYIDHLHPCSLSLQRCPAPLPPSPLLPARTVTNGETIIHPTRRVCIVAMGKRRASDNRNVAPGTGATASQAANQGMNIPSVPGSQQQQQRQRLRQMQQQQQQQRQQQQQQSQHQQQRQQQQQPQQQQQQPLQQQQHQQMLTQV